MHYVSEDDLDNLATSGDSIWLAAFGISTGGFISLFTTINTVNIPDPSQHAMFVSMAWLSGFVALLLLCKVVLDRISLQRKLKKYKTESMPLPMGSPTGEPITSIESVK